MRFDRLTAKDTSVEIIIGIAKFMTVARIVLDGDMTNKSYWVGFYIVIGFL